jgi:hypothetical protein
MSLFEQKGDGVVTFKQTAERDGLLVKMLPARAAMIVEFVRLYEEWKHPHDALHDYQLRVAPLNAVFKRTRELGLSCIGLLESWDRSEHNAVTIKAETGEWTLPDDDEQALEALQQLVAGFTKFNGAQGLPPSLRRDALAEQGKAHVKARQELPAVRAKQKLSELQAGQRDLGELCDAAFNAYHDFLDGYFGRTGDEAYAQKAKYGYDRRAGRYARHPPKKPAEGAGATGDPAAAPPVVTIPGGLGSLGPGHSPG